MALKTTNKNRKAGKAGKVEVIEEVVEKVEEKSGASDLYSATDWIDEGFGVGWEKVVIGVGVICFVLFFFV